MKTLDPSEVENAPANSPLLTATRSKASILIRKGNGQPITRQTAAQYLHNAGGDLDRARSAAKKDGWLVADGDSSSPVTIKPGEPIAVNSSGERAVIRAGKWVDVHTGMPIGPEGEHFRPETHVFSKSQFREANPSADVARMSALAKANGYKVVE